MRIILHWKEGERESFATNNKAEDSLNGYIVLEYEESICQQPESFLKKYE